MKKKQPNIAKATSVKAILAPVKDIFLKNRSGSIAWVVRSSQNIKAASKTTAAPNAQSTLFAVQLLIPAWIIP